MSVPLCCIRRNPASVPLLPGRRFFCRNLFPVAVLSRGDFSRRRFYAVTLRRPAAGVASVPLLPGRRFFCRNLFPVAVLSRGDFSRRRFYAVTLRRPAAGVASAPLFLGRRFFRRNPCPVAELSRGDFSRHRFYAVTLRRPAAGVASLLPSRSRRWAGTHLAGVPATRSADTPARAPGALVAEYPQHRAVGLLLGEEPRIVFVVALVAVDDDVLRCRDQAVLDAAETAQ